MGVLNSLNRQLNEHGVEVRFSKKALDDLQAYDKGRQKEILALIVKRGIKGPLIRPEGIGEPLGGGLVGFTKIKSKSAGIRIIYRPVRNGLIKMEIVAIGPRDKEKVYRMAAKRLISFQQEMESE